MNEKTSCISFFFFGWPQSKEDYAQCLGAVDAANFKGIRTRC